MAKPAAVDSDGGVLAALRAWAVAQTDWPGAQASALTWGVAYSGGADSTALLLAAQTLWPGQVHALHVHHGLQPAAEGFVEHAQRCCATQGVPLTVSRVDARPRPGQSPEDAARQARYLALATAAQRLGLDWVLLGQHAQDQVETVLLAWSRGAGLAGLAGMAPEFVRHGQRFARPLLAVDGEGLRQALDAQGLAYVQDPTNADLCYTRNRIRTQVLPVLAQTFPAYLQTFARSARHAAQAQGLLRVLATEDLQRIGTPPRLQALQSLARERQANVLRHWLQEAWQATPSAAQLEQALHQIAACTTRGHAIRLKIAHGHLVRAGAVLDFLPSL